MRSCSIRYLNLLVALLLAGVLAACATTNTGSESGQSSSVETPDAGQVDSAATGDVMEQEQPVTVEPADLTSSVEPVDMTGAEEAAEAELAGIEEATTGSAPQNEVVEPIAEFPEQPYVIDEPMAEESAAAAEIEGLREQLAATESELERMQAEEAQRDYTTPAESAQMPDEATPSSTVASGSVDEAPAQSATPQVSDSPEQPIRDLPGKPVEFSVYFEYDQSVIGGDHESVVRAHAEFLKANPGLKVEIQGNCDERGSREYNIALGQRRALAVKQALELLGVDGSRIEAVSFGSEKPVAFGHDEESWRLNRRADIVY